jgi:hypothetical protein
VLVADRLAAFFDARNRLLDGPLRKAGDERTEALVIRRGSANQRRSR